MCLIGLAIEASARWPLVVAANRDEYFDRPAAPLAWWRSADEGPWLLGGRDLAAGGTWMALSQQGRIAMLTNVRDPSRTRADAASRGALVTAALGERAPSDACAVNPFNLIVGDIVRVRWQYRSDSRPEPQPLDRGVHGLSNAALGTPWPKVRTLCERFGAALERDDGEASLVEALFAALSARDVAADHELPDTGIGLARERLLAPAFITTPDGRYGTRSSTVLLGERRTPERWRLRLIERTHDAAGRATATREVTLDDWPRGDGARPAVRVIANR